MHLLLAFDKFKDSLTAAEACEITATALRALDPTCTVDLCPMADGGDGFAALLTHAARGQLRRVDVHGPRGGTVRAHFGVVAAADVPKPARAALSIDDRGSVAVVEMAAASGLALLPSELRDPWRTTSFGTGELVLAAARAGASAIVLGIGGSATHDLGIGALEALGLRLRTTALPVLAAPTTPADWEHVSRCGGTLTALPPLYIACDVGNPLLGPNGAAAMFARQKGLRDEDVSRLDVASAGMARLLCEHFRQPYSVVDQPGTGAAGGMAFGLLVAARAVLLSGFEFVADWLDLDRRIRRADVVITGEGRFDKSSLQGKAPGEIARRAVHAGKPVHLFAGAAERVAIPGAQVHIITPPGEPLARAVRNVGTHLARTVRNVFGASG